MKKIPTLFVREPPLHEVTEIVTPGCEWVLARQGTPTTKIDGTACLVEKGRLWKRRTSSSDDDLPENHILPGYKDDKRVGWLPVGDHPEDQWHREAWNHLQKDLAEPYIPNLHDGTYELVGPKIQGNPYNLDHHQLWRHGDDPLNFKYANLPPDRPLTFEIVRKLLTDHYTGIEGIVWHHPDGRMAKIKRKDFGLPWPVPRDL